MADLIDLARAKQCIDWDASFSAGEDATLENLIDGVSEAIERFCRRTFASTAFDETYNGWNSERLILRQYPVISVQRIASNPLPVLHIENTSTSNQRATVATTNAGLSLVRIASGVTTTDTSVIWSTSATILAVATAVNAIGSGWSATYDADYSLWPSADLMALQGAYGCRRTRASLKAFVTDVSDYTLRADGGWLIRSGGDRWWDDETCDFPYWSLLNSYRIQYTAGYATVPEDVQEAAALWVADLYEATKHQPNYQAKATSDTTAGTATSESWFQQKQIPARVLGLIQTHRKLSR